MKFCDVLQSIEREMKEASSSLQSLGREKKQLQEEDQEMIKRRAKLEFDVKDLEEGVADDQRLKVRYDRK